jgi:hypothetical protein
MNLNQIKEVVEQETEINLLNKTRKQEIVYARSVYYKLCKTHTRSSLTRIGASVKKNHATVLHGIKLYDNVISRYDDAKEYKEIHNKLDRLFRRLNNTTEKIVDPANYYRERFKETLLELRKVRTENRLLKKQLTI